MAKSMMRAVGVVPGERTVRLIEHETPEIAAVSQVKVRSLEVGVCGTDREICTFVYGSPPDGFGYLVLGHESLGQVVEVGSGVSRFKPGDLVVPSVRRPCPHARSEEHTSELQSLTNLVCRLLLEKKKIDSAVTTVTAQILCTLNYVN